MSKRCTDEILLSSDKMNMVIAGSGVLADPAGINRGRGCTLGKAEETCREL